MKGSSKRRLLAAVLLAALVIATAACGDDDNEPSGSGGNSGEESTTVRLGYFPNVTHATAIVGVDKGIFEKNLGSNKLETGTFKDGTEASEALSAEAIDATYIGSGPAINLYPQSGGEALRIVRGQLGWCRACRQPRSSRPKTWQERPLPRPSGQHPGRGVAGLVGRSGARDRPRRWRRPLVAPQENSSDPRSLHRW